MTSAAFPFFKMNGIGNAILVVDGRESGTAFTAAAARAAARLPGLAFDQLMAVAPPRSPDGDPFVTIFNADGTEAGACGNGTRCVAWVLMRDRTASHLAVETAAGRLDCVRLGPTRFSVDMGAPQLGWREIPLAEPVPDTVEVRLPHVPGLPVDIGPFTAVGMGNPHAVFFVPDVDAVALDALGPVIEHHPLFPQRVNVSFAQVLDPARIRLRVWERSAGATLACGSAACAAAVAAARRGLTGRTAQVGLPGGELAITWRKADDHVIMAGDVALEHAGVLPADLPGLAA